VKISVANVTTNEESGIGKPSRRTAAFTCRAGCKEREVLENRMPAECNALVRRRPLPTAVFDQQPNRRFPQPPIFASNHALSLSATFLFARTLRTSRIAPARSCLRFWIVRRLPVPMSTAKPH